MEYLTCFNQKVKLVDIDYKNKNALIQILNEGRSDSFVIFEKYYFQKSVLNCDNIIWHDLQGMNRYEAEAYFDRYYKNKKDYRQYIYAD